MDFDTQLKLAIYQHIAHTTRTPSVPEMAALTGASEQQTQESYRRLYNNRVLVLGPDGVSIRMAPPFSGIPTQHVVRIDDKQYYANCAWDALGIPAALHVSATVLSRCEQTREPLRLGGANGRSATRTVRRSFCGAGRALVERHHLHVSHDVILPVGRTAK